MKKLSIKKLRMLIEQEIKHDLAVSNPEELEAREDAWEGGDNLVLDINHAAATSDIDEKDIASSPESLSAVDASGVVTVTEAKLRNIVRRLLQAKY